MPLSRESRALRKSYEVFTSEVDPDTVIKKLYSRLLLTRNERERATQKMLTKSQQLEEVFECLERRVSTDPSAFNTLVQVLLEESVLEGVGKKMQAYYEDEDVQSATPSAGLDSSTASPPTLSDRPTLAQLQTLRGADGTVLKIIAHVAADWGSIAINMDFDPNGRTHSTIQASNHGDVTKCCEAMFKTWLRGEGKQPATWSTLIEILNDCSFKVLADNVEKVLSQSSP